MKTLVTIAAILAINAAASRNLPWILLQVRKAQIHLIIESQASKWPRAITLPEKRTIKGRVLIGMIFLNKILCDRTKFFK